MGHDFHVHTGTRHDLYGQVAIDTVFYILLDIHLQSDPAAHRNKLARAHVLTPHPIWHTHLGSMVRGGMH